MQEDTKKVVKIIFIILIFAAAIGFLYLARSAWIILLASIFIAIIIDRPVTFLAKHLPKGGRGLATFLVIVIVLAIVILAVMTIVPIFIDQTILFIQSIPDKVTTLKEHWHFVADLIDKYNLQEQYSDIINSIIDYSKKLAVTLGSSSVIIVSGLVDGIINFVFILVLTFSFLAGGKMYFEKIMDKIYLDKKREKRHIKIAKKLADVVGDFFVGQVIVCMIAAIIVGVVVFVLSLIFGFTGTIALPAALIIFILSFIPIFGAFIGAVTIALLLLLYSPISALIFLAIYICYQQVESNFVSPKVQAKKLNMPPVAILLSIIFGLKLFGGIGAIIAIPIGGCIIVLAKEIIKYRKAKAGSVS
jgi:predicted PurR-regulated permease PerM